MRAAIYLIGYVSLGFLCWSTGVPGALWGFLVGWAACQFGNIILGRP